MIAKIYVNVNETVAKNSYSGYNCFGDVMKNQKAKQIALGGLLAAMAVVVMSLGGMIPVATYVCCVVCMLLEKTVLMICGRRIAWAWYGAVAFLGILLGTDKEAAAVFVFIGYYPILKPLFEKTRLAILLKLAYFNVVILTLYWCLIHLLGMSNLAAEFGEFGKIGLVVLLLLGNITFLLVDRLITLFDKKRR